VADSVTLEGKKFEVLRYDGKNGKGVLEFINPEQTLGRQWKANWLDGTLLVHTPGGDVSFEVGDYVLRHPESGIFYAMPTDEYDAAREAAKKRRRAVAEEKKAAEKAAVEDDSKEDESGSEG
jgi:hypothetical protein